MNDYRDYREKFLQEANASLSFYFDGDNLKKISDIIVLALDKYELSERTTEVGFVDDSLDKVLQLYAGSLLTEGKSKITVAEYIRLIRRFFEDVNKTYNTVGVFDIRAWLVKQQSKIALISCENYRSYLSAFFQWLYREEFIERNPMAKISTIKYEETEKKEYTDVEIDSLRTACNNKQRCKLRDRAILEVLINTGIRVAELCDLDIEDIDFNAKQVLIRCGKGKKKRMTYTTDLCLVHLKKYLDTRKDSYSYLFVSKNKTRLTPDNIRDTLKTLEKLSGVENVHPHRFRRTFATNMYRKGMDIHTIQLLLGHSNINTTMKYINDSQDIVNAAYRKFA